MIVKINFPKETLIISSIAQSFFDFLIRFFIIFFIFIFYKFIPSWKIIFFPFLIIPLILFTISIGFILSLLNCLSRDTINITNILTTLLFFLTPILYNPPEKGILIKITRFNILFYLVSGPRDVIIYGKIQYLYGYLFSTFISIFLFFFFWRAFHLAEYKMAEMI